MIGISFKYDAGYDQLKREQFYELFKAFTGMTIFEREVDVLEPDHYNDQPFTRVDNADDLPTEPTLVVLTGLDGEYIQGDVSLVDYVHPENAIYWVGDDHSSLTQASIGERTDYDAVYIPVEKSLFSTMALSIALFDRQLKNG